MLFASPASAIDKPTIRVTAKTESTISVAWTASSGATRYDVTLWENSATVVSLPRTDPFGDEIGRGRHITYGLVEGDNTYVVRAIDSAGNASAFSAPYTLNVHLCA
jgi:hypothetical protein